MLTEYVILLIGVFFVVAGLVGRLQVTFEESAPKLGAKIEKHLETGSGFSEATEDMRWRAPQNSRRTP